MNYLTRTYARLSNPKGQTMAEYALILGLIAVVCLGAYTTLGGDINTVITTVANALKGA
jgi:pilus assembly protein Flp/PilA